MGYQNLGGSPPRIYVDYLSYWHSQGLLKGAGRYEYYANNLIDGSLLGLNPSNTTNFTITSGAGYDFVVFNLFPFDETAPIFTTPDSKMFSAILGHNFATNSGLYYNLEEVDVDHSTHSPAATFNQINPLPSAIPLDGFTINHHTPSITELAGVHFQIMSYTNQDWKFGSFAFGHYFDCPVSPDLSLTMSHEYDGIKTIRTKGGSTLSNANYYKPPNWGDREAWQLGDFPYYYNGRRSWDLSFSYISDSDIEPYSYYGNKWDSDTSPSPTHSEGGDNWFQNVLYYTMGSHLPFIFCPDPSIEYYYDSSHPERPPRVPEFAICRFDMNSFKRTLVAHKMYSISVKVVESW